MLSATVGFPCLLLFLLLLPMPGSTQYLDPQCGIRARFDATVEEMFPWMAFLHTEDGRFICSGTLISHNLVLTAAHCFLPNTFLTVRLGERSLKCRGGSCSFREEHRVSTGFKHRSYDPITRANDIAILRLASFVVYKDHIRPICIVWDTAWRQRIDSIEVLTGTGWGISQRGSNSDRLLTVDIRRKEPEVCNELISFPGTLSGKQFCAGNWDRNLCNIDSGGPVGAWVQFQGKWRFVQIGIQSFTNNQCEMASVFTDVLSHIDSIMKVSLMHPEEAITPLRTTTTPRPTYAPRPTHTPRTSLLPCSPQNYPRALPWLFFKDIQLYMCD